ncbi:hypothetical protein [Pseudomonas mosselii]|uniref:hypothetical protein n=1 Tax=Pseudomonas mosselii TaxID=78327 RepID=UPI00164446B3|nr:hypothetical protein [Pseudomonas mosselii]MBC3456655.1 hypothetical protein [Pseudomonas mosselii]
MSFSTELELIFHKSDGLAFQDFFNDLMIAAVYDFCPVRQQSDGGNDGFVQSTGTFYQVYSPQAINTSTIYNAAIKVIDDFDKLAKNWHYLIKLEKYIFVYNDKFKGADSSIIRRVLQLRDERGVETEIWTAGKMEVLFHELALPQQDRLITKHARGRVSRTALKTAADKISSTISVSHWNDFEEQLCFYSALTKNLDALSNMCSILFFMDLPEKEKEVVTSLAENIMSVVNLFYSDGTIERNNERVWDNSWKCIDNHPMARDFDAKLRKWHSDVQEAKYNMCKHLNLFASYVRERLIPDFLNYEKYTLLASSSDAPFETFEFVPQP